MEKLFGPSSRSLLSALLTFILTLCLFIVPQNPVVAASSSSNSTTKIICLLNLQDQEISASLDLLRNSLKETLKRGDVFPPSVERFMASMHPLEYINGVIFEDVDASLTRPILSFMEIPIYDGNKTSDPLIESHCSDNVLMTEYSLSEVFEQPARRLVGILGGRGTAIGYGGYLAAQRAQQAVNTARASLAATALRTNAVAANAAAMAAKNHLPQLDNYRYGGSGGLFNNYIPSLLSQSMPISALSTTGRAAAALPYTTPHVRGNLSGQNSGIGSLSSTSTGAAAAAASSAAPQYFDPYVTFPGNIPVGAGGLRYDMVNNPRSIVNWGNVFGIIQGTPEKVRQGVSVLNDRMYTGARKATTLMNDYKQYRESSPNDTLTLLVNKFEEITTIPTTAAPTVDPNAPVYNNSNAKNPFDLSKENAGIPGKVLSQLNPSQTKQMQVMNSIIGTGFDMFLNTIGSQHVKGRQQNNQNVPANTATNPYAPFVNAQQFIPRANLESLQKQNEFLLQELGKNVELQKQLLGHVYFLKTQQQSPEVMLQLEITGRELQILKAREQELLIQRERVNLSAQQLFNPVADSTSTVADSTSTVADSTSTATSTDDPAAAVLTRKLLEVNSEDQLNSFSYDQALAYIAGCDCDAHPDGAACPMRVNNMTATCMSMPVWDAGKGGAELANVIIALDKSLKLGVDTIMLPIWFGSFDNPLQARLAPRVLKEALKRVSDGGIMVGLAAGDNANVNDRFSDTKSTACEDLAGMSVVCASSIDEFGKVSSFSTVPLIETVYAVGENVKVLNSVVKGTGACLANTMGVINMIQGITNKTASPIEQLGMVINPVRRVLQELIVEESTEDENQKILNSTEENELFNTPVLNRRNLELLPLNRLRSLLTRGGVLDAGRAVENALVYSHQLPPEAKLSCFEENVKFVGSPFLVVEQNSVENCHHSCSSTPSCNYFSFQSPFQDTQGNQCFYYDKVSGTQDQRNVTSGYKFCPSPEQKEEVIQESLKNGMQIANDAVYPGAAVPLMRMPNKINPQTTFPVNALTIQNGALIPDGTVTNRGIPDPLRNTENNLLNSLLIGQAVPSAAYASPLLNVGNILGGGGTLPGLGQVVTSTTSFFKTSQALFEAGNALWRAVPMQQMLKTGQQLYNSGFFRKRGMKTLSRPGVGLEKQSVLPPPGVGNPSVMCLSQGMTCCVPQPVVDNWKEKPPYLNGDKSELCRAHFVSLKNALCATSSYNGDNCGLVKTETTDFILYSHILMIPGTRMNNAICVCKEAKSEDNTMDGYASWEFSVQAVTAKSKEEGLGDKLAQGVSTALAWAQLVNKGGNAAVNGLGQVINQVNPDSDSKTYDIVAEVPGLVKREGSALSSSNSDGSGAISDTTSFFNSLAQGAKVISDAAQEVRYKQLGIPPPSSNAGRRLGEEGNSRNIKGSFLDEDVDVCTLPWPEQCKAWRSVCEENSHGDSESVKCQPVEIVENGCPKKEFNFVVSDRQSGILSFSFRPFMFSRGEPFRVECIYSLLECSKATVEHNCQMRLSSSGGENEEGEEYESRAERTPDGKNNSFKINTVLDGVSPVLALNVKSGGTLKQFLQPSVVRKRDGNSSKKSKYALDSQNGTDHSVAYTGEQFRKGLSDTRQETRDRIDVLIDSLLKVSSLSKKYISKLKCSVITFNGKGRTILEANVNRHTGEPMDAAQIIGFSDSEGCEVKDLKDFHFASKFEILPFTDIPGSIHLEKYRGAHGESVEL